MLFTLINALKGDGLMRVQLSSSDKMFGFTHAAGTEFAGVAQLKASTFALERDNTAALTYAMLQSDSENTTSVKVGEQSIGGLAMNGGTLTFDTDIPAATLAEGYISVDTLVVGAGDYTWKGRNYQVNGMGDVLIDVPKPWNDPMANNPLTTLNLMEHDDSHVGVQLVKAQTVIGSGGSLTLRDLQGDEVEADKTLHIAQNGTVVAEGDYGFRLTTAPGDGLYVNYGLKALNIHGGQKLTLAEHGGAYGATADMSAKIGGEGDLAINTVRQVSLSNGQNDYQGATYVQMGTLRTDADGALGNTRELAAIVDLNGSTQTVETFTGQMGSTVLFKEGSLTVNKGGISQGELTGGGNLNVTGGTLAIEGLKARYNALTSISPNAEVSLDNTQGLGRGNIANDGLLTLKNVTGELRNSISGKGIVSATARTDVELDGDNSRFVGQFNIDTGSALSVNEQKNLGDASVINNGLLTISTERSWVMTHSISGSGDVTKLGTGILTLNKDSAAYKGTTDIVGGEIAFGSDSAINMASQHINIHNSGVMSGNVTTAGDVNVMPGGTLRVAKTTVGGNLENGGTVQMNSEGGKPGNVLTVNGNYTGNDAVFNFFDNLLPDSPIVRDRIVKRYHAKSRQPFDLLSEIGRDSVGAVTLLPENETITRPIMAWEQLTEARLEEVLTAYKADIPLGMIREENDFRISVAGAQEKTALLRIGNDWCIPKGITPTTHIIKLPSGEIRQPNATLDLSQSVDNEYYCLLLAKELGLNVPDAEIIKAGNVRALAVERFDRRWNAERTVLLRLPQENMCQTFGLPSSVKYESDGGPGIARIMAFLMGSSEALKDRYDFMKFQVFQWLIGATDGHAKNFSVFIQAGGSYRLTPFYDIISAFPVLGGAGIHISDLKLAMGLNASKGKKTAIDKIYPRHFLATAKVLKFPQVQMHEILSDFARMIPAALDNVKTSLPTDFPENVVTAVETNVLRLHRRLSREWY
ncbi:TPA: hypothetical protein JLI56_003073 [Escherichia coli]|nr:hypothetical protein [Escherichia coli]